MFDVVFFASSLSGELCIARLYTERRKTHAEIGRTGGHIGYREGVKAKVRRQLQKRALLLMYSL